MNSRHIAIICLGILAIICLTGSYTLVKAQIYKVPSLLAPYEMGEKRFQEVKIKDKMIVYYHNRMIGDAIVEKDRIVYQFDMETGELLKKISHWREDIPEQLPPDMISAEDAAWVAKGNAETAILQIMSPESNVFHFEVTPSNPCWIVRTHDESGNLKLVVVDAVEGDILGYGTLPSVSAFSLAGAATGAYPDSCYASERWDTRFAIPARDWFEQMGYPAEYQEVPTNSTVQEKIQSNDIALFYEIAHGDQGQFMNFCSQWTTASLIEDWLGPPGSGYEKMVFTLLHSCHALCYTGDGYLEYEFRKGEDEGSAVVGYCGLPNEMCWTCSNNSDDWETSFFTELSKGATIEEAFDQACADVPECLQSPTNHPTRTCVCMEGDPNLTLVPTLPRKVWISWADVTTSPLNVAQYGWGVAWGDYDNDGDPDIYLSNQQDPLVLEGTNKLFKNMGGGLFYDATGAGPLAEEGKTRGAAWGDYDNDGDLDLYMANDGFSNKLVKNLTVEGQPDVFEDVTASANLPSDQWESWGVAWADYDNDGHLDFYVANDGSANKLFRNNGDGTFNDVTDSVGAVGNTYDGRGAAWADYDNDGDLDLYLVNYSHSLCIDCGDRLFRNNSGIFEDVTDQSGLGGLEWGGKGQGMMAVWGDYDNDEDLDIYLVNYYDENNTIAGNTLFENNGDGTFTDVTGPAHGFSKSSGVAAAWGDYDNDGDLDIYAINRYASNRLYRNEDTERFVNAANEITGKYQIGSSGAWGDYDSDGDLDLYLANLGSTYTNRLFKNTSDLDAGNNWLQVKLHGTESNRAGIGARVKIIAGGKTQIREVSGGTGRSQDDLKASFGLGSLTQVQTVEVSWPSGLKNTVSDVSANQVIIIEEQPQIQNVVINSTFDSATYTWDTEFQFDTGLPATSAVLYDPDMDCFPACSYSQQQSGPEATHHVITLPDLEASTEYCYKIVAQAVGGDSLDTVTGSFELTNSYEEIYSIAHSYVESKGKIKVQWKTKFPSKNNKVYHREFGEFLWMMTSVGQEDCSSDRFYTVSFSAQPDKTYEFRISTQIDGTTYTSETMTQNTGGGPIPLKFTQGRDLSAPFVEAYPNPSNPATALIFNVPARGEAELAIYGADGRIVKSLVSGRQEKGVHKITWDGTNSAGKKMSSGVYFVKFSIGNEMLTRKIILLR